MESESLKRKRVGLCLAAILIILGLVIGWYFLFPVLGLTLAVGAGVWGFVVASIVVLCLTIPLFFIVAGVGIIVLGLFAFVWTVLVITLFPILFPILIPLLVVVLLIALLRRKR